MTHHKCNPMCNFLTISTKKNIQIRKGNKSNINTPEKESKSGEELLQEYRPKKLEIFRVKRQWLGDIIKLIKNNRLYKQNTNLFHKS